MDWLEITLRNHLKAIRQKIKGTYFKT